MNLKSLMLSYLVNNLYKNRLTSNSKIIELANIVKFCCEKTPDIFVTLGVYFYLVCTASVWCQCAAAVDDNYMVICQ